MSAAITLIIADDHSIYLEGLHTILQSAPDIKIIADAVNGEDLVKKVVQEKPDIVLTDINMPVKDGIAATKEILKLSPATGVIALSVSNDDSNIVDMLEAGAAGYLLKSSDKHEIFDAIYTVHKHGTYYCRNTSGQLTRIILKSRSNTNQLRKQPVLSDLEVKIIKLLCRDKTSKEIAREISLSNRTVEAWRLRIQEKLNVRGTAGIVVYAIKNGIYKFDKNQD